MLFNETEGCFGFFKKKMISIQYLKRWILFKLENDFAIPFVKDSLELTETGPRVVGVDLLLSHRADLLVVVCWVCLLLYKSSSGVCDVPYRSSTAGLFFRLLKTL